MQFRHVYINFRQNFSQKKKIFRHFRKKILAETINCIPKGLRKGNPFYGPFAQLSIIFGLIFIIISIILFIILHNKILIITFIFIFHYLYNRFYYSQIILILNILRNLNILSILIEIIKPLSAKINENHSFQRPPDPRKIPENCPKWRETHPQFLYKINSTLSPCMFQEVPGSSTGCHPEEFKHSTKTDSSKKLENRRFLPDWAKKQKCISWSTLGVTGGSVLVGPKSAFEFPR